MRALKAYARLLFDGVRVESTAPLPRVCAHRGRDDASDFDGAGAKQRICVRREHGAAVPSAAFVMLLNIPARDVRVLAGKP